MVLRKSRGFTMYLFERKFHLKIGCPMKKIKQKLFFFFLAVITSVSASEIRDLENQKLSLEYEINKLNEKIEQANRWKSEDQKRYQDLEKRYQKNLNKRSIELDSLQVKIQKMAENLKEEVSKQNSFKLKTAKIQSERNAVAKVLEKFTQKLISQIEQSLPWERETRKDRARAFLRDIQSENAREEEAFIRLKSLIEEEIRFGDEIVIIHTPLQRNSGDVINARLLRIGNQWMVYSDENNTVYGALKRSQKNAKINYEWVEDLNLSEREAIKLAIDVKQARKAPQMVVLPLSLSIQEEP